MNDRVEVYGRLICRWQPGGSSRLALLAVLAALLAGAPRGYSQSALPTSSTLSVEGGIPYNLFGLECTVTGPWVSSGGYATGSVTFNDLTAGNAVAAAPLGPPAAEQFSEQTEGLAGAGYIATADFNGDGKPDIAVMNDTGTLTVMLGNGDGTFPTWKATALPTGGYYGQFVTGAFAGGTTVDVAIPYYPSPGGLGPPAPEILVLIGNNDGTFQPPVAYPVAGQPTGVAVADLRGIGKLDLAVSVLGTTTDGPGFVSVLLGNGDGTFQTQVSYPAGPSPQEVIAGPLPSPGTVNLLTVNGEAPGVSRNTITLLTGNGDGTFGLGPSYPLPFYADAVAMGDFNNDGLEDLAVEGYDPETGNARVDVLFGAQTGTVFGSELNVWLQPNSGAGGNSLIATDFAQDGNLDLAFTYTNFERTNGQLQVLFGSGYGGFSPGFSVPAFSGYWGAAFLAAGDFNGDGYPDIALSDGGGLRMYLGDTFVERATATFDTTFIGTHQLDCAYGGDSNYAGSTSPQVSLTVAVPPPVGAVALPIDATTRSTAYPPTIAQSDNVLINGWAADPLTGAPVTRVQVTIDGDRNLGNATLGIPRPDVVAVTHNFAYYNSGWSFTYPAAGLAPTYHTLQVTAYVQVGLTAVSKEWYSGFYVAGTQTWGPPFGDMEAAVDATTRSTTVAESDSLLVSGWAVDPEDGAPVSSVTILTGGRIYGTATLGIARPDVAARFNNSNYLNSGWTFTMPAADLNLGYHGIVAVATDALGLTTTFKMHGIDVSTTRVDGPPFGSLDKAVDAATGLTTVSQSDNLFVAGWAADYHDAAPVHQVSVLIDGAAVGNATLGFARPDVARKNGARYRNSGWEFTMAAASLSVGQHTVTAVATDSLGLSTQLQITAITVTP
jgi:hypothetical protein